jgi:hypothetical protein
MPSLHSAPAAAAILLLLVASSAHTQPPRLTPLTTIGCESCGTTALFTRIRALGISPAGEILVVDNTAPLIRIFTLAGQPRTSLGRAGDGPGELRNPIAIARRPDKSFEIVDIGKRALLRLDSAGNDRGLSQFDGFPTTASFAPRNNFALIGITGPRTPDVRIVRVTPENRTTEIMQAGMKEFPLRPPNNPDGISIAVADDGSFALGDGAGEYVIRRYAADGSFRGEIRRDVAKVKRTPEEIRELAQRRDGELAKMQEMMGRSGRAAAPMPGHTDGIPLERNYFDPDALRFDEKGRLWVRTERAPPGSTIFDVFDSAGRLMGEVRLGHTIRDYALGTGMLAVVTTNGNGFEQVVVWRAE